MAWGRGARVGQVVIFILALLVFVAHTFSDRFHSSSWQVTVDSASLWLFVVMAGAVVLPFIRKIKIGKEGLEAAIDAADQAIEAAGPAAASISLDARGLESASRTPVASLEESRRALAEVVKELAVAEGLGSAYPSLGAFVDALMKANKITPANGQAVLKLAQVIADAKAANDASPGLAREVNYATQMLGGLLRQQAIAASKGQPKTPSP